MRLIDADRINFYKATVARGMHSFENVEIVEKFQIDRMPTIDPESLRPRWIPVSDRLPETGEVLATNGDVIAVAPASSVRRKDTYITHWMPLPELPGGGDPDDLA